MSEGGNVQTTGILKRLESLIAIALARASSSTPGAVGEVQEIRFPIGTGAAQNSGTAPPNGAIVTDAELDIGIAYSPGASIQVGIAGTPALLMGAGDNVPQAPGPLYAVHQVTPWTALGPVLVSVAGAPVAGSGFCILRYVQTPQL